MNFKNHVYMFNSNFKHFYFLQNTFLKNLNAAEKQIITFINTYAILFLFYFNLPSNSSLSLIWKFWFIKANFWKLFLLYFFRLYPCYVFYIIFLTYYFSIPLFVFHDFHINNLLIIFYSIVFLQKVAFSLSISNPSIHSHSLLSYG